MKEQKDMPAADRLKAQLIRSAPANKFPTLKLLLLSVIFIIIASVIIVMREFEVKAKPGGKQNMPPKVKLPLLKDEPIVFEEYIKYFRNTHINSNDRRLINLLHKYESAYDNDSIAVKVAEGDAAKLVKRYEEYYGTEVKNTEEFLGRLIFDTPEVAVGKFFTITGRLLQLYPEKLVSKPDFFGKDFIYFAVVDSDSSKQPCWVYLTEKPEQIFKTSTLKTGEEYIENTRCRITGLLVKLQDYETQDPKVKTNTAAVFVARRLTVLPADDAKSDYTQLVYAIVAACFIISAILLWLWYNNNKKHAEQPLAYQLRRLRKQDVQQPQPGHQEPNPPAQNT